MEGIVSVVGAVDAAGNKLATQTLVDRGLVPSVAVPAGWGAMRDEICLGLNNYTLNLRQFNAYLFGYRAPVSDYVCANFGLGTGTNAPNVTDVALESPINFYNNGPLAPINYIDFPEPFVARVSFTIGINDANGFLITEYGLFSGNGVLLARKTSAGLNKDSSWSPTLLWRVRF
jgi:hypothetical protein